MQSRDSANASAPRENRRRAAMCDAPENPADEILSTPSQRRRQAALEVGRGACLTFACLDAAVCPPARCERGQASRAPRRRTDDRRRSGDGRSVDARAPVRRARTGLARRSHAARRGWTRRGFSLDFTDNLAAPYRLPAAHQSTYKFGC